jgi:protein-tyrosine kinase
VRLETVGGAGVELLLDPESPVRRYYEDLAANLLSLQNVRTVVVTNPEPGAGCTSVCLGLGAALSSIGHRAAVIDCNLESPQLHRMLGEPNFVGLTSGLVGEKSLEHYGHEVVPGLLILPTGPVLPDAAARLETESFVRAVRGLEESRDIVILDAPVAGRVLSSPNLSERFDGVVLVVHASHTSKRIARETTDDLLDAGVNLLGVVLNGCR